MNNGAVGAMPPLAQQQQFPVQEMQAGVAFEMPGSGYQK